MDKEKAKALSKTLACYKELQENNSVNLIEFHTADGQKHGIGNPEAIKLLLSVAVIELEPVSYTHLTLPTKLEV